MRRFNKYKGLKYRNKGRDKDGVDCYGIIYLIFKEERGIILPDFLGVDYSPDFAKKGENHIINEKGKLVDSFQKVDKPYKLYDILLFSLKGYGIVNHCGMYLKDNKFIHIYKDSISKINRLQGFWESNFVEGCRFNG